MTYYQMKKSIVLNIQFDPNSVGDSIMGDFSHFLCIFLKLSKNGHAFY